MKVGVSFRIIAQTHRGSQTLTLTLIGENGDFRHPEASICTLTKVAARVA